MLQPFQRLTRFELASGYEFLIAALGPKLLVLTDEDKVISEWTSVNDEQQHHVEDVGERPSKKQKTSAQASQTGNDIIILASAPDCGVVVVVSEDKTLTVLTIDQHGAISESSRRAMPKRPSAVQIISSSSTILCADKFGDVYALPIYLEQDWPYKSLQNAEQEPVSDEPRFKPSATELTVHSKRNRLALESQQRQKNFTPRKAPLAFEHKLIIGHVSMLTEMVYAHTMEQGVPIERIITADRDEHVRVSRSLPQPHIIEGYCMGHGEFISKLCAIDGTSLLVSGGGDDWLGLWDWTTFELLHKIDLRQPLVDHGDHKISSNDKLAVLSLCQLEVHHDDDKAIILAACERIPAIWVVAIDKAGAVSPTAQVSPMQSNPLAIERWKSQRLVVSFDARDSEQVRLQSFKVEIKNNKATLTSDTEAASGLELLNTRTEVEADPSHVDALVYNVASLRKRRGWDEQEDEPE